jgi:hypothetical protein
MRDQRLEEVVVADLDVCGHERGVTGVRAAEQHVFARGLDVAVPDLERTGRVVSYRSGLSAPASWKSLTYESTTATYAPSISMPRRSFAPTLLCTQRRSNTM